MSKAIQKYVERKFFVFMKNILANQFFRLRGFDLYLQGYIDGTSDSLKILKKEKT